MESERRSSGVVGEIRSVLMGGGGKMVGGRDSQEECGWLFVFSNSENVGERSES